jgi:hypothetical protein
MTATLNASTANGVILTSDTSGNLAIQSNGTTVLTASSTGISFTSASTASPAFSAYQSSAQTLSSSTWTKIQVQTKEFDTNSCFDNATNYRFTPTVAGYYMATARTQVATSATDIQIGIYKNGSSFKNGISVNTNGVAPIVSALIYLNGSTDYIEIYARFGVGQNTVAGADTTYFQAAMVRSA